jgi:diguanylate cyclase
LAVHPSFSAGLTAYRAGESLEACIDRADKALYRAKSEGLNRTVIWNDVSPTMGA